MTAVAVTLRSPAELLAAIPYILGFTPTDSIVVIALTDGRVGLTTRVDLPDPHQAHRLAKVILPALTRESPEEVIVVAYEDDRTLPPGTLETLTDALADAGISINYQLLVRGGRWRILGCDRPECCPPEGTPLDVEPGSVRVASEFVGHGSAPLASRDDLARAVEAGPKSSRVGGVLDRLPGTRVDLTPFAVRGRASEVLARILDTSEHSAPVSVVDAVAAAVLLGHVPMRDGLIAWLTPGTVDRSILPDRVQDTLTMLDVQPPATREGAGVHQTRLARKERLIALAALLPDRPISAHSLCVLGAYCWWLGDGATALVAIARGLRCDPDHRLARLLRLMIEQGVPLAEHTPTT